MYKIIKKQGGENMEKKNNGQQKKGLFPKVLIALLFIGVIGAIGGGCSSEGPRILSPKVPRKLK